MADKDVLVEKPMALNTKDAEEMLEIAEKRKRILMVGHLLIYHPVVDRLKEMVDSGELGRIYYIYTQRVNLGVIRQDENALLSFAPHDLSVILYLLEEEPMVVTAHGESYIQKGIEDVVFLGLQFSDGKMANIHLSWLDPHKLRRITIVGSKKMVVFDDMEASEKLKIYDKGVKNLSYDTYGEYLSLRFGDITIPSIKMVEPLRAEAEHFIQSIESRKEPKTGGRDGLKVVKILMAAQESLKKKRISGPPRRRIRRWEKNTLSIPRLSWMNPWRLGRGPRSGTSPTSCRVPRLGRIASSVKMFLSGQERS